MMNFTIAITMFDLKTKIVIDDGPWINLTTRALLN